MGSMNNTVLVKPVVRDCNHFIVVAFSFSAAVQQIPGLRVTKRIPQICQFVGIGDVRVIMDSLLELLPKDHSATIARLTSTFESFQGVLHGSTIEAGHNLREAAREFDSRLTDLAMKEALAVLTTIVTTSSSSPKSKSIQLPKIALP